MERPATRSDVFDSASTSPQSGIRRARYPSDLSNQQWERIAPLLPVSADVGRQRQVDLREVLNGINFRWTTGCVWRMLPHDLPPWGTIYTYYRDWQRAGLLPFIRDELTRKRSGRRSASSAGSKSAWITTGPARPAAQPLSPSSRPDQALSVAPGPRTSPDRMLTDRGDPLSDAEPPSRGHGMTSSPR